MKTVLLVGLTLALGFGAPTGGAQGSCPPQSVHAYGTGALVGHHPHGVALSTTVPPNVGSVSVVDTNLVDCDGNAANAPDYDGDLDAGVGGGAFGWGPNAAACGPHTVHGGNVVVTDYVWGMLLSFVVAENDQTATGCQTDGIITDIDPDDCVSVVYVGVGTTCGSGGGDGLYWVVFVGANPPPFGGIIAAF